MQGSVAEGASLQEHPRSGFEETELERRGKRLDMKAPVTGAVILGKYISVGFGDGKIRFFTPECVHTTVQAHAGVVLCMTSDGDALFTGGDDGRFLKISANKAVEEIANFGTQWVDCVAAIPGQYACSSGRIAYIWSKGQEQPIKLEHKSTVGGLAFDSKGRRLAVAHYGGVTIWERKDRRWKATRLVCKGFHGSVNFSPDGKYVVTAMQENALHGWRLRDKGHLSMAGYPAKVKSFVWVGNTPYLVTSGADEAICWPFDGKDGPLGRAPVCVAHGRKQIATCVYPLSQENAVFTGFRDGSVVLAEIDESKEAINLKGASGAEITAISVTENLSHVLIGDEDGQILWAPLWAGQENV